MYKKHQMFFLTEVHIGKVGEDGVDDNDADND